MGVFKQIYYYLYSSAFEITPMSENPSFEQISQIKIQSTVVEFFRNINQQIFGDAWLIYFK